MPEAWGGGSIAAGAGSRPTVPPDRGEPHDRPDHDRPDHDRSDKYSVVFENDRVRVLEYRDTPGALTRPHGHPDSVMLTMSGFERRLTVGDRTHLGENIGSTASHSFFVELKEPRPAPGPASALGPSEPGASPRGRG